MTTVCPSCEDPEGHQYDDDMTAIKWGWDDVAQIGDPCVWCDHEKCAACPPPRGKTWDELHAAGEEACYGPCCELGVTAADVDLVVTWLEHQAAREATGSRDFGRGFAHAAVVLKGATALPEEVRSARRA